MTSDLLSDPAELLRRFGREECSQEPLYVALCEAAAANPRLLALLEQAPIEQRKANLLLAALHERVLAGVLPELAAYYPSMGGTRAPDGALSQVLDQAAESQWEVLCRHLRHGATQTNEVGRCAALWPALGAAAAATGARHLALLDFGCSAGLNLGVEGYQLRYRMADGRIVGRGTGGEDAARVESRWLGSQPLPEDGGWQLTLRHGVDPAPVDLGDPDRLRWLLACLWPHDTSRAERLRRAAQRLGQLPHQIRQAHDCVAAIGDWIAHLPAGVQPVLLSSWVLYYLSRAELERLRRTVNDLALARGLVWITAELPHLSAQDLAPPPLPVLPAGEAASSATLWTLRWPEGGRIQERSLAWSHPHGRWVHWLG